MGVPGTELNVVAHHEDGHAPAEQRLEDLGEHLLELRVQALGGLVHQQDLRVQQQHLCQRRPLLLAAGQVVGVAVQQLLQAAQPRRPCRPGRLDLPRHAPVPQDLKQVLPDRLFHKQRLGVLRQHPHAPMGPDRSPVGLVQSCQQLEGGGLARAVAAQEGQEFPLPDPQTQALHHIGQLLFVFEPQVLRLDGRALGVAVPPLLGQRLQRS